jgi:hypothetical protein
MQRDTNEVTQGACPACDIDPFVRNAYWTGKLLLARDFIDEQSYTVEKLRHHNQQLHGTGVVCGLRVVQHDNPTCRNRYVYIEPGNAVDCCGHDILVKQRDILDLYSLPQIQALQAANDTGTHTLQICVRYRECPTEPIPVLYDECAEDSRCAPNRILESYAFGVVMVNPKASPPAKPAVPASCADLWYRTIAGCPHCDLPDCVVLATIENYTLGNQLVNSAPTGTTTGYSMLDNITGREILPSSAVIKRVIDCLIARSQATAYTGITALSWTHAGQSPLATITLTDGTTAPGVVVQFGAPITIAANANQVLDSRVFEVLLRSTESVNLGLDDWTWSVVIGQIVAVNVTAPPGGGSAAAPITAATQLPGTPTSTQAVAFLFQSKFTPTGGTPFRVRLQCDFVVDANGNAVSGAFLRGTLPTGQHKDGSPTGIEGGLFESWFILQ